ncbi:hypothetical protein [Streptomyces sp. NPDC088733]|uniref:hypothetical protein n=1 Tax=Streptomyces sp. NPDC088733 TaxID=3365880 RepID=UPI0038101D1E
MNANTLIEIIMSWTSEQHSHRGRLARAFRDNMGDDPHLQAQRLTLLGIHAEKQSQRKAGLALV